MATQPRRALFLTLAIGLTALSVTAGTAHADTAVTFSDPVLVDSDTLDTVSEPSVHVAADGAIYVSGPSGLGGARVPGAVPGTGAVPGAGGDLLWRSDDQGKTFTFLGSYDGTIGGGDSDITSTPDGTLYASGLTLACVTVARSTDKGASWAPNPAGCTTAAGSDDRQWNDTHGNGDVWTGFGSMTKGLALTKVTDATSPLPVNGPVVSVDSANDYQWPGVVTVDQTDGTAYMVWNTSGSPNDCDTGCSGGPTSASKTTPDIIRINGVRNDGTTLVSTDPIQVASRPFDTFDSFVAADVDKSGRIFVAWSERHPGATAATSETWIMVSSRAHGASTWTAPTHVLSAAPTAIFPWVSAGDDGRVAVSYIGTPSHGYAAESTVDTQAPWYVYSALSQDAGATFTEYKTTPDPIYHGRVCTSGTGCTSSNERELGDFFETDTDATGCLVTSYPTDVDGSALPGFVRQTSGPGLLSSTPCTFGTASAVVPEAPVALLLPVLAAGALGVVAIRRRRA